MGVSTDSNARVMRADLHVHSYHSGYNHDLPFLRSRDCYNCPEAVYRTAKARGMDIVTITDHDSIDGCLEFLSKHPDTPDFIIGEEITCWMRGTGSASTAIEVHIAAYGMTEQAHRDIQPLRENVFDVIAYLREAHIFYVLNHLFHFYRGQMPMARYLELLEEVPALETRNGAMLAAHNRLIEAIIAARASAAGEGRARHAAVGGSDAHTLRRIGRTWTSVPATTREEFLANLAAGRGVVGGDEGGTFALAADIYGVIAQYWLNLVGLQRGEISLPRRALGLGFSVVSAPFEFIPLLIAAIQKRGEAHRVREFQRVLGADRAPRSPAPLSPRGQRGLNLAPGPGPERVLEMGQGVTPVTNLNVNPSLPSGREGQGSKGAALVR
jgi:predicted metal-dependent phosphoesterase TrpH